MKVSLTVMTAGKSVGQTIPVTLSQFIIGRDPQCNLRPASAIISKRHCAVLIKNGKVSVRDFESTNGTFVNDKQVKGEVPLSHEDILKVGPLAFRVVIEKTTPVNKPTPPPAKQTAAGAEEDVAAMLLSIQEDEGSGVEGSTAAEESDIPGGSTVMDVLALPSTATDVAAAGTSTSTEIPIPAAAAAAATATAKAAPAQKTAEKPNEKPAEKAAEKPAEKAADKPAEKASEKGKPADDKKGHATARDAARAILEKHFKRRGG